MKKIGAVPNTSALRARQLTAIAARVNNLPEFKSSVNRFDPHDPTAAYLDFKNADGCVVVSANHRRDIPDSVSEFLLNAKNDVLLLLSLIG